MFRDAVIRGEIPVCREIEMEMNRIDDLIANPGIYYDDQAVEGFISYCENELTLTDGSDLKLLDTFKVWAEQILLREVYTNLMRMVMADITLPSLSEKDWLISNIS